ncbi:protein of unknown function DUF1016 [Kineococcus radiotolerans SRS30216 = ATCC BAA-149]|uniref:YhcG PDDEXK nuclease domain-containing protein n=1 Tax=Kineococcus radiotolerans (strain ATCC BAA-149 / DSM 14245 / SRS30216) TaxID=266940 RepID=A6WB43_KINRD|nr:protein of unknown function DUF1016 [Kineococcus radiotolerans SRS30216 = ATCC BAA-149]
MRAAATAWPEEAGFVQQAVARLPWGHLTVLLGRLDERATRDSYATHALQQGWSRDVLANQIDSGLHTRIGAAPSNFEAQLPQPDSELAQQLTRDPYVFDHLALTDRASERAMEQGLVDRLQQTLTAFGHGMAFVGRQVRFTVGEEEMIIDRSRGALRRGILFHIPQVRYIVIELKIGRFTPAYTGQLGAYVALIDDRLRDPTVHAPTVGILLCKDRDEHVVRYALAGAPAPMAVATYTYDTLPPDQQASLPTPPSSATSSAATSPTPSPTPWTTPSTRHPHRPRAPTTTTATTTDDLPVSLTGRTRPWTPHQKPQPASETTRSGGPTTSTPLSCASSPTPPGNCPPPAAGSTWCGPGPASTTGTRCCTWCTTTLGGTSPPAYAATSTRSRTTP